MSLAALSPHESNSQEDPLSEKCQDREICKSYLLEHKITSFRIRVLLASSFRLE